MEHTRAAILENSRSAMMAMDWTRNLSLHLASGGGSDLMACRTTTEVNLHVRIVHQIGHGDNAAAGAHLEPQPEIQVQQHQHSVARSI